MTRSKSESQVVEAYRWAIREGGKVSLPAGRVLAMLLTYTDLENGKAYPSQRLLAVDLYDTEEPTRSQINMVSKAVCALEKARLIECSQMTRNGKKTVNLYTLNVGRRAHLEYERLPSTSMNGLPSESVNGHPSESVHQKYPVEVSKGTIHQKRGRHLSVVND